MYGQDATLREEIVNEYKDDLTRLIRYLPYLEKKSGKDVQRYYEGDARNKVIPVPVYDSTLLGFVKEAQRTKFITRNYPYVYRRWRMTTPEAERIAMEKASIRDIELFRGILSKYVLEGMRKSVMWTTAVDERIFVTALKCLNHLIFDYSEQPRENRPYESR